MKLYDMLFKNPPCLICIYVAVQKYQQNFNFLHPIVCIKRQFLIFLSTCERKMNFVFILDETNYIFYHHDNIHEGMKKPLRFSIIQSI